MVKSSALKTQIGVSIYQLKTVKKNAAIVYITDGDKAIENGMLETIHILSQNHKLPEATYVFVSTIDQETSIDHRNDYFFCNEKYLSFFENELFPNIEGRYIKNSKEVNSTLIGMSFGGLNAAYFSGKTDLFVNYVLFSPITYPCDSFLKEITFSTNEKLGIFISTGTYDAETYTKPLTAIYRSKGFYIKSKRTNGGHDFDNWNGQIESALNFLYNKHF
ncbi:MAG: alpha/beta hydrolase-fold protein [Bacteroidota bacterium]